MIAKQNRFLKIAGMLFLSGGAVLAASPALAQNDVPPPPPPGAAGAPPYGGARRGGPDQRAERMQQQLNLTSEQTAKVRALMESEQSRMEALHSNTSLSPADMRTQMIAIRQESDARLRALLTPDQLTRYEEMRTRVRAQGQRGDGSPSPPPPSPPGSPQL